MAASAALQPADAAVGADPPELAPHELDVSCDGARRASFIVLDATPQRAIADHTLRAGLLDRASVLMSVAVSLSCDVASATHITCNLHLQPSSPPVAQQASTPPVAVDDSEDDAGPECAVCMRSRSTIESW